MKNVIPVRFSGIDGFNRPVFKEMGGKRHYGFTNLVFTLEASEADVMQGINPDDIEFFGHTFNCEPHGGRDPRNKVIIVPTFEMPGEDFQLLNVAED